MTFPNSLLTVAPNLIGRDLEFATLVQRIEAIDRAGSALVIRGEAGIGKSATLDAVGAYALSRGLEVLKTTAVQSEVDLPFAGLHQLILPLFGARDQLPNVSRRALDAAFGRIDAPISSPFLVALAILQLLGERHGSPPLIALVDDVHWLDPASADVLAFIARRIESEPTLMIFGIREGFDSPLLRAALPEMMLAPLDATAAAALLDVHSPSLPPAIRTRILEDAAGNPLALVELPVAIRAAGLDHVLPPPWLPLTARLTRLFSERFATLSAATRQFLLAVAANDLGNLTEIIHVAERFMAKDDVADAITEAALVRLILVQGSDIRFAHPLIRSAIYETARLLDRQAVHAALADVVAADSDRRAWHLANGALGTDDEVANVLEEAARRALSRGGTTSALRMMDRAARVTSDPSLRASRSLWAADLATEAGRPADTLRILSQLNEHDLRGPDRPYLTYLRDVANDGPWTGSSTVAGFARAADELREQGEVGRAIQALTSISLRCWWSNPDAATRALVLAAADRLPLAKDDPMLLSILALAAPEERGSFVVERLDRIAETSSSNLPIPLLAVAATGVGHLVAAERWLGAAVAKLRAEGGLGLLAKMQVSVAWTSVLRGNWRGAALSSDEAIRLAEETGQPRWAAVAKAAAAILAAYQGEWDKAEALVRDAEQEFVPDHANPMLALVQCARGAMNLAADRPDAAYEQLSRIYDPADVAYHPHVRSWALVDLAEAAVRSSRSTEAGPLLQEQVALLNRTHWPLLREQVAAARALLDAGDTAEDTFRHLSRDHPQASPFLRARVQLAYGVWLKRRRRALDSRPQLRAALEVFDALGGAPWAQRARRELRASGESSRRRQSLTGWLALSPQELQIAELAAEGLSNKEIARQLFLSHRTVGSHLYRIFPKLGITTRSQLQQALTHRAAATPAVE